MSAALHLDQLLYEPERLAGFIEITGTFLRHTCTVGRNLEKLLFSGRILTLICHLLCKLCITMRIINNSLAA